MASSRSYPRVTRTVWLKRVTDVISCLVEISWRVHFFQTILLCPWLTGQAKLDNFLGPKWRPLIAPQAVLLASGKPLCTSWDWINAHGATTLVQAKLFKDVQANAGVSRVQTDNDDCVVVHRVSVFSCCRWLFCGTVTNLFLLNNAGLPPRCPSLLSREKAR